VKTSVAGQDTRARLITAAEQLFAERGVDAVSLNEINRAAGQRNASSLQYHFGDRAGLLKAVMDKHGPDVDARRDVLLQQYRDAGQADLRALAAALVLPLAAKLSDPDGGREYLRTYAELVNRPDPQFDVLMNEVIGTGILTGALFSATGNAGNVNIAANTLSITGNSGSERGPMAAAMAAMSRSMSPGS